MKKRVRQEPEARKKKHLSWCRDIVDLLSERSDEDKPWG
jgi:hypothetical protein